MAATKDGTAKPRSRGRGRARSATATATSPAAAKSEQGEALLDTLYKRLEDAGVEFEKSPNKSQTYTRLRVNGKAFAYIFPPRPNSVAVKIPKQLLDVEKSLPNGHGFKRSNWGLTRTISSASDATVVAKAFKVAAARLAAAAPVAEEAKS
jgi:hypothetical protein